MRKRLLPVGVAMALALGLLTAAPAQAAYAATISFPGGNTDFYSPFDGDASIQFDFNDFNDVVPDPSQLFRVRIRPVGGALIKSTPFSVNPATQSSPVTKTFSWPALSTNTDKAYEVLVNPDGQPNIAVASFILHPRLVTIGTATPNPFLPWIDDGIKDTTNVKFTLGGDADAEARVYRPKTDGKCCGALVLTDSTGLNNLSPGIHTWTWDGQGEGANAGNLSKGDYFVKIAATDPSAVTKISKPLKVTIARTYQDRATMQKDGMLMHHTGPVSSYRRGGNCFVSKDGTDRDLWITCLSASFTVYWRWALPTGSSIVSASFTYVPGSSGVCNGKKGHTKIDSTLKVGGVGQFHCRVDKAKITYSHPVPS
jgi:hypothetical protein